MLYTYISCQPCVLQSKVQVCDYAQVESTHVQLVSFPVCLCCGSEVREECTAVERCDDACSSPRGLRRGVFDSFHFNQLIAATSLDSWNQLQVYCLISVTRVCVPVSTGLQFITAAMNAWMTPDLETGSSCSGVEWLQLLLFRGMNLQHMMLLKQINEYWTIQDQLNPMTRLSS